MNTITIGVNLAKSVFSVCEVYSTGRVLGRDLGREAFALWLAQFLAGTVVAMEAQRGASLGAVLSGLRLAAAHHGVSPSATAHVACWPSSGLGSAE